MGEKKKYVSYTQVDGAINVCSWIEEHPQYKVIAISESMVGYTVFYEYSYEM